jgi:hypothetical protein
VSDEVRSYIVQLTEAEKKWLEGNGIGPVEVSEDHVLEVKDGEWTLEHPLRCRTRDGGLIDCPVTRAAGLSVDRAGVPGRYRVKVKDDAATKLVFLGPA